MRYTNSLVSSMLTINILIYLIKHVKLQTCPYDGCKCQLFSNMYSLFCTPGLSSFPTRNYDIKIDAVTIFIIKNNNLNKIPDDSFLGLNINNLKLDNNNIKFISKYSFRGIVSLKSFGLNEPFLNYIEEGAFTWIADSLETFDFSYSASTNERFEFFIGEISSLTNLKSLILDNNNFTSLEPAWLESFSNLESISLANNELKSLDKFLFKSNPKIKTINLSNNYLFNFIELFTALRPLQFSLNTLILKSNKFEYIINFPLFQSLTYLDLSFNSIKTIDSDTFKSLNSLIYLYLFNNKLNLIESNSFLFNSNIEYIYLSNNYLNSLPNITSLNKLKYYDVSNQNGQLQQLSNYALDVFNHSADSFLELNLALNDIASFGDLTFCSSVKFNFIRLKRLAISLNTFKSLNKCLLNQVHSTNQVLNLDIVEASLNPDYSQVCDCNFRLFSNYTNINLNSLCDGYNNECDFKNYVDSCAKDTKYMCDFVEPETTLETSLKSISFTDLTSNRFEASNKMTEFDLATTIHVSSDSTTTNQYTTGNSETNTQVTTKIRDLFTSKPSTGEISSRIVLSTSSFINSNTESITSALFSTKIVTSDSNSISNPSTINSKVTQVSTYSITSDTAKTEQTTMTRNQATTNFITEKELASSLTSRSDEKTTTENKSTFVITSSQFTTNADTFTTVYPTTMDYFISTRNGLTKEDTTVKSSKIAELTTSQSYNSTDKLKTTNDNVYTTGPISTISAANIRNTTKVRCSSPSSNKNSYIGLIFLSILVPFIV